MRVRRERQLSLASGLYAGAVQALNSHDAEDCGREMDRCVYDSLFLFWEISKKLFLPSLSRVQQRTKANLLALFFLYVGRLLGYAPFYSEWTINWVSACDKMGSVWTQRWVARTDLQAKVRKEYLDRGESVGNNGLYTNEEGRGGEAGGSRYVNGNGAVGDGHWEPRKR